PTRGSSTLSLHDALPILQWRVRRWRARDRVASGDRDRVGASVGRRLTDDEPDHAPDDQHEDDREHREVLSTRRTDLKASEQLVRSEEHTSELQSLAYLVS